jgi:hypothetical protein
MHLAQQTCTRLERTREGLAEPYRLGNGHHVHAHSAQTPWPCSSKQGSRSGEVWQEEIRRGGVFSLFWRGTPKRNKKREERRLEGAETHLPY